MLDICYSIVKSKKDYPVFDELPWLATKRSGLLQVLKYVTLQESYA
jgi:hypothetical protein